MSDGQRFYNRRLSLAEGIAARSNRLREGHIATLEIAELAQPLEGDLATFSRLL
jgi:hypothetical protein